MGISRGPADWVSYKNEDTGKVENEFVTKGKEREYFLIWKARQMYKNNPAMLQLIDKNLDQLTDWNATRKFGSADDLKMNMVDHMRMMGGTDEQIARKLADPMGVIRDRREVPDLAGVDPDALVGGTPEELRLAEDEWEAMQPIGTGTGVDPTPSPGEWKNGVLEIPSMEGGLGARIDLNNQPWMRKKKK